MTTIAEQQQALTAASKILDGLERATKEPGTPTRARALVRLAKLAQEWAGPSPDAGGRMFLRDITDKALLELVGAPEQTDVEELNGIMLLEYWRTRHEQSDTCPRCSQALSRTAIIYIVYTFQPCSCGDPQYEHLVEQAWHRVCFRPLDCSAFTPFWVRGVRSHPGHYTEQCQICGRTETGHQAAVTDSPDGPPAAM